VLNDKINIDAMNNELTLPKVLQTYRDDFGSSEEAIIRFVWRYYESEDLEEEQAVREVCHKRNIMIRYE